ncbi:MAG: hypothetical protein IJP04_04335, partial [Clostridia bacterium]|nr:hypothetical protein [Clostridia bacterium]
PETPDQAAQSPTPAPGQTPQPTEEPEENPPPADSFPWWILLLILAGIGFLIWRYLATDPVRIAARQPDQGARIYFAALCGLLALENIRRSPRETLHDFALRADQARAGSNRPMLLPLADAMAAQVYGKHPAPAAPFREAYLAQLQLLPWPKRLLIILKRMFSFKKA